MALLVTACSSSAIDIESLGLDVDAQIQAGFQYSLTVPVDDDITLEVVSTPRGVAAALTEAAGGTAIQLTVAVDADTPRGAYNLGMEATRNGQTVMVGWPFEIIDASTAPPAGS